MSEGIRLLPWRLVGVEEGMRLGAFTETTYHCPAASSIGSVLRR
ncbi:hypothetical protein [Nocardia sp. Marseille-Q1738]